MFVNVDQLIEMASDMPLQLPQIVATTTGAHPGTCGQGRNQKLKSMVAASLDDGDSLNECVAKLISYDQKQHTPPLFTDESEPQMKGSDIQVNALRFIHSIMKSINQQRNAQGLPPQAFSLEAPDKNITTPPQIIKLLDFGAEMFDETPPPIEWLVDKTFRLGAAYLFAGMGDIGKGYLLLDLAKKVSLTNGKTLPPEGFGAEIMAFGQAVIISCEDDKGVFHQRIANLDPNGLRHKYPGRLIMVPLPDAGGVKPFVVQSKIGLTTTPFFDDITKQLLEFPELKLVVFDTLQGLFQCDFNADPAAGQYCAGVLQKLATVTGACVIAIHHMKKGTIKSPAEAREAIRGTTAIVDGLRGAYALWSTLDMVAKKDAEVLNMKWASNLVVNGAIVKSNSAESKHIATFIRNDFGLLEDYTHEIKHLDNSELRNQLVILFENAKKAGKPFFKTGKKGVHGRNKELPKEVHAWGREKLEEFVQQMANDGLIVLDPKAGISVT